MIRSVTTWIRILTKRQIISYKNWLLICILPIIAVCLSSVGKLEQRTPKPIFIYCEEEDEVTDLLKQQLASGETIFDFRIIEDRDLIYSAVESSEVECGYIFKEDQMEKMISGCTDDNIILVERLGSAYTDTINEIVFSEYFRIYAKYYVAHQISEYGGKMQEIEELYEELLSATGAKISVKVQGHENAADRRESSLISLGSSMAIIMFLYGFISIGKYISDHEKGFFRCIQSDRSILFRVIYFMVDLACIALTCLLAFVLRTPETLWLKAAMAIILYSLCLAIIGTLLSFFIHRQVFIVAMLPILFGINMILYPVFLDLVDYYPIVSILRKSFVPQIFIWLFEIL